MSTAPENIPDSPQSPPVALVPKTKRKYSDIEIACALTALDANKGNVFKTSAELGIPNKTLDEWSKATRRVNVDIEQMRNGNTRELSDIMETAARSYLEHSLDPYVIGATSGRDAVFAAAIAVDKMQLLRGQPTSIIEERVEPRAVLVLMSNALGIEDPAAGAIDVTPEPRQIEGE